jgi:hypothetical protein
VRRALLAGAAYFAVIFALGFVLGALRETVVAPRLGALAAVLIEVPAMLAASYAAARFLVRRLAVPDGAAPRLAMGGVAFALLMLAETLVGVLLMGRSPGDQLAAYSHSREAIGLAAQIAFALIPLIAGRQEPS